MSKNDCPTEGPFWYDGKFLNEVGFCEDFLQKYPMVCVSGSFFTKEGRVADEEGIRKQIYEMLRPYLNCGLAKRTSNLLEMLRLEAYAPNLPIHEDRLHVANGTLFLSGEFTEQKDFCRNRLPVKYDPEAPQPVTWLHFLSELLEDEDIPPRLSKEAVHLNRMKEQILQILSATNPLNRKAKAEELDALLGRYIPSVEAMRGKLKKYDKLYKELAEENTALEQKLNSASRESIQKKLEIQRRLSELDELRSTVDAIPDEVIRAYTAQRSAHHSRMKQEV